MPEQRMHAGLVGPGDWSRCSRSQIVRICSVAGEICDLCLAGRRIAPSQAEDPGK